MSRGLEKNPVFPCARLTVYSESATRSVVAAHYTRIQLKPRIYSMGGFKAMQPGRNRLVFRASPAPGLGTAFWSIKAQINTRRQIQAEPKAIACIRDKYRSEPSSTKKQCHMHFIVRQPTCLTDN